MPKIYWVVLNDAHGNNKVFVVAADDPPSVVCISSAGSDDTSDPEKIHYIM